MSHQQSSKVEVLENVLSNAEARDRMQQGSLHRLTQKGMEYASMLRSSECGTFEESIALRRSDELRSVELVACLQENGDAQRVARDMVAKARIAEEAQRRTLQ